MTTFDVGKLLNKIKDDIPGINAVLRALARWDVSTFTDVPEGAMQATTDANKRLTLKQLIAGTWAPITKLMHDVDTVDGYHASTSVTAGTIPVRDQHGALVGNITGNAATATEAEKLSAGAVVPVNQGGTGATTSSGARANLGAASGADFEEHESMLGGKEIFGHMKLDEEALDASATAAPGGYGWGSAQYNNIPAGSDLNTYTRAGYYACIENNTAATIINTPEGMKYGFCMRVEVAQDAIQFIWKKYTQDMYVRYKLANTWKPWQRTPYAISDVLNGTSPSIAASEYALAQSHSLAVAAKSRADAAYDRAGQTPTSVASKIAVRDYTDIVSVRDTTGPRVGTIRVYNDADSHWIQLGAHNFADGSPQGLMSKYYKDEGFVRLHGPGILDIGDFLISFNATVTGFHICQGAVISRTTYRRLFEKIGTTFGAGNGSTTFNLPDARNRTIWGASDNLGATLAAGLPNITGSFSIRGNQVNTPPGASGAMYRGGTGLSAQNSSVEGGRESENIFINASRSSAIYGKSTTVQPPALALNVFIKF